MTSDQYSIKDELCFYIGPSVVNRFPEEAENLKEELLNLDCLIVCRHVVKEDKADYYIMMTNSFCFMLKEENKTILR